MGMFDWQEQDEASRQAEEHLKKEGIILPWHYNDSFGGGFKALALRTGGFGAVFFVKSTSFGEKIYAAKTLQQFLKNDYLDLTTYEQERIAKDFLEEALPWLKMGQHPNIVPVHLLENIIHPATRRNVPFVISEFMERGDLKCLVIEKGRLSLEETFSVGLQICEGLLHAYKHGISAHKDLKPENIMVYRDGIYKVTDFSAGVMGTPGYMAPEQAAGAKVDHRADQFAIGLIMHDIFKGGDTQKEQIKRIHYGIKEVLSDDLPESLRGVIARCLQPGIKDRFDTIFELKKELLKANKAEFKKEYRFPDVEIDDSPTWWFNRGFAFYNIGRYDDAVTPYEESLKRLLIDQTKCLMELGIVYQSTGRFSEAEKEFKLALIMLKEIPGTEMEQVGCLMELGIVYRSTGKFSEAEENYKEALKRSKVIPGTEIDQARCLGNLGRVYQSTGRFSEAEINLKDALGKFKEIPGTEIEQARSFLNLGVVYQSTGRFSEAEENYKDALRMFKAIPGTEIEQARCLMNLGNVYGHTDKFSEIEVNYKDALGMFKAIPGTEIDQANCLNSLGLFNGNTDNLKDALRMFKAIPGTEIDQANCLVSLGLLYTTNQEFGKAKGVLESALEICERYPKGTEQIKNSCLKLLDQIP